MTKPINVLMLLKIIISIIIIIITGLIFITTVMVALVIVTIKCNSIATNDYKTLPRRAS